MRWKKRFRRNSYLQAACYSDRACYWVCVLIKDVVVVVVVHINSHNQIRWSQDRLQSLWSGRIPQEKTQANQKWYTDV